MICRATGKKIKGRKRYVAVDTQWVPMQAIVHSTGIHDRDGGILLMGSLTGIYPSLPKLYVNSGCQGLKFQEGLKNAYRKINVEIIKRTDMGKVVVLPIRWVIGRTIVLLNRCRRLASDWECLKRNALTFFAMGLNSFDSPKDFPEG